MNTFFEEVYTNSKFKKLKFEIIQIIFSYCVFIKIEGTILTYQINDQREIKRCIKWVTYQVYFNKEECWVKCMCRLFEIRKFLFRHILDILSTIDVRLVLEKYIIDQ